MSRPAFNEGGEWVMIGGQFDSPKQRKGDKRRLLVVTEVNVPN